MKVKALKEYSLVELVTEISVTGGMMVDLESVCIYQDIIGHSTVEEVKEVANSELKESFYRLYGVAYGTVPAIKYYLQNSDNLQDRISSLEETAEDFEEKFLKAKQESEKAYETLSKYQESYLAIKTESEKKINDLEAENKALQEQIKDLKVMLFDMMTK